MNMIVKKRLFYWFAVIASVLRYAMVVVFLIDTVVIVASFMATRAVIRDMQNNTVEQQLFSDLKDAESGQRGYLYTDGDTAYLPQYYVGVANVKGDMVVLSQYLRDNLAAADTLAQLKKQVVLKLSEMDVTVRLFRDGKKEDAKSLVKTNRGIYITDNIRNLVDVLRAQERDAVRRHRMLF